MAWFEPFIALAVEFGMRNSALGRKVRNMLANNFRSLWSLVRSYDQLEEAVEKLLPLGWEKVWLAIRHTMRFDKDSKNPEGSRRLGALEQRARPATLVEQTTAVVLTSFSGGLDITDGDDEDSLHPYERAECYAEELGRAVVADAESLQTLLPSLVENKQGRLGSFGAGLAKGSGQPENLWQALVSAFESTEPGARGVQVLLGFLGGLREVNRPLFERLLDDALMSRSLSEWVPILQTCAAMDERGCDRLMRSLEQGCASADKYRHLAYGRVAKQLSDSDMARLALAIAGKDHALLIALEVLAMYLFEERAAGPDVAAVVRELMPKVPLAAGWQHQLDFPLKLLIEKCMAGPDSHASARALLKSLRTGFADHSLSPYDLEEITAALFVTHPIAALDELIGVSENCFFGFSRMFTAEDVHQRNPLASVPLETLISWCRDGDSGRWSLLAGVIPAFAEIKDQDPAWTDASLELVRQSPEPMKVIQALVRRLSPDMWSGSRANIMSKRLPLLDALESLLEDEGLAWLRKVREELEGQIERERAWEKQERNPGDNSFE
jgi:hypothetical protein